MRTYGLVGETLGYSFSKQYFADKFKREHISNAQYLNFELPQIADVRDLPTQYEHLSGFNVTIPFKEAILPYLTEIENSAQQIGAVNTVKISNGTWTGYNTDAYGFEESIKPNLQKHHNKALILGTGGAGKAIKFVLNKLGIAYAEVSRTPTQNQLSYPQAAEALKSHFILINTTPLGTHPSINEMPPLPLQHIGNKHLVFDLIYNPNETKLLKSCRQKGAIIQNGLEMLKLQAEKAWQIWQDV